MVDATVEEIFKACLAFLHILPSGDRHVAFRFQASGGGVVAQGFCGRSSSSRVTFATCCALLAFRSVPFGRLSGHVAVWIGLLVVGPVSDLSEELVSGCEPSRWIAVSFPSVLPGSLPGGRDPRS